MPALAPPGRLPARAPGSPISVSELNRRARDALESSLPLLWVRGEISNLTRAASGHVYFTLKDDQAQVRCVMFRSRAQLLGWRPENGQQVETQARVTLYEARGDYQLNVEAMRLAGRGDLYAEFLRLKERLEAEGLFDPSAKRPLPGFPRRIGIVTSPQAAALRDVVTTLGRRAPHVGLILYPTPVQGETAGAEIAKAIELASRRAECDLLILCRGGGSLEDLWSFNDERVARALRRSSLPVISGVGHETDFTIADFAADLRAPTPTAAAELASPARADLVTQLAALGAQLRRSALRELGNAQLRLDYLCRRLRHPADRLRAHQREIADLARRWRIAGSAPLAAQSLRLAATELRLKRCRPDLARRQDALDRLGGRIDRALHLAFERKRNGLATLAAQLRQLAPQAVLERGYSIVTTETGEILRNAASVEPGAKIVVNLSRGSLDATVEHVTVADAP